MRHNPSARAGLAHYRGDVAGALLLAGTFLLACTKASEPAGHGGASEVVVASVGHGGTDAGIDGAGGKGGGKDWDGGGEGGWIEQADAGDAGCPSAPNGGIGTCVDTSSCPPLTVEQAACWQWTCDCTGMLCYCVAVPMN